MRLDTKTCTGCGYCMIVCPAGAISRNEAMAPVLDPERCTDCGLCAKHCPTGALG